MQQDATELTRRNFLQWAGRCAAVAGVGSLAPETLCSESKTPLTDRRPPVDPVILRSAEMSVVLDRKDGLPYQYHLGGRRLRGEDYGVPIHARVCRKSPWATSDYPATVSSVAITRNRADFSFVLKSERKILVAFVIRYDLHGKTLVVTLENIQEEKGYELISIAMPRLVTVREEDGPAWLVHGDSGGSLTFLNEAATGSLPPNSFWGNVQGTLPVVMVGTAELMCVQETTAFMDGTELEVNGDSGRRRASLGTEKYWRVDGSGCYNLNLGRGVPYNCGTEKTPNLLVEQQSSCRLDFLAVKRNIEDAWLDAAKLIRGRMPSIPSHFYDDKYIYGIRCDQPRFPEPAATFPECEERISATAELIDNWPQLVHLWGWQFRGKDTGYPAVDVVNERLGGYDGLMRLMQSGGKHNATITLSDNYDDAYRSSPAWSDSIIARRPDGELWKSRNWTGEDSYIIGMAKYMSGPGRERVRYTCERYKLPGTTHIDVLSYFSIRNDWDPEHPASGIRNLLEGRYRVLEEFKSAGVDVSSEALRYPMIGHISCYWYAQGPGKCPFGGQAISLLPLVYRRSAVWGLSGGHEPEEILTRLDELFLGATPRAVGLSSMHAEEVASLFYLWLLPWFRFHLLDIESFHRDGDDVVLGLARNSFIKINYAKRTHQIVLRGEEVARTGQVTCPMGEDRIAFYSLTEQKLSTSLPGNWDKDAIGAVSITPGKRTSFPFHIQDGRVEVSVPAKQPVILYAQKNQMKLTV